MNIVIVTTREQSVMIVTVANIGHTRRSTMAQAMVMTMIGGIVRTAPIKNVTTDTLSRIIIVATISHAIIQAIIIVVIVIIATTIVILGAVIATTMTPTNG